jgi:hypothetical protein
MTIKGYCLRINYPIFLSYFNGTWNFIDRFSKNTQISNFIEIGPVGAELFLADGQTDITKLVVASRSFANAPKKAFS